ncbi:MAG: TIGR03905 family TSCPD domain-containing protein [Collinsella sp.]
MISFDYKPQGVCARNIHLDLSDDGNKVLGVEFTGGCDGNLKAISKLVEGAPADRVVEVLAGNTCGRRRPPVLISSRAPSKPLVPRLPNGYRRPI